MLPFKQDTYWGIKVFLSTGAGLWYVEKEKGHDLSIQMDRAKVFMTKGSAERFIAKLKTRVPQFSDVLMEAHELRVLQ